MQKYTCSTPFGIFDFDWLVCTYVGRALAVRWLCVGRAFECA